MQISPWFLGACACACLVGGVAGTSIAADPVSRGDSQWMDTIPNHQIAYPDAAEASKLVAPRDQYDLETPNGVIPVSELAFRGRLRDRYRDVPMISPVGDVYGPDEANENYFADPADDLKCCTAARHCGHWCVVAML